MQIKETIINHETRIIDLTLGDLINAISSNQPIPITNENLEEEELGGISLAQKITGLAKQTIYSKICSRSIPFMKIPGSKKLYFSKKDLQEWISSNKKPTAFDISNQALEHVIKRKAFRS